MPKKNLITTTSDLPKIKTLARHSKTADIRLRWQIIYTLIADNRSTSLIAIQLGCSEWLVRDSAKNIILKVLQLLMGLVVVIIEVVFI